MTKDAVDPSYANLAAMVFANGGELCPILHGCLARPELRTINLSLGDLRRALLAVAGRLAARGIAPGDTVALVRLPHSSELPAAVAYLALSVFGVRVLFPMYVELDSFGEWLEISGAGALVVGESAGPASRVSDAVLLERLTALADAAHVPMLGFDRDLGIGDLLRNGSDGEAGLEVELLLRSSSRESECLLLTTSGSSGHAKMVRYTQGALLRSCAAWEEAGLFAADRLGGRGLSLLLGHSMGLRGLWNALWTRQPLCLVTPEWFLEHPERVSSLLLQMQPQHVTGGPATFYTLLEFARLYPQLKERCLRSLRCLVSSGSGFDLSLSRRVRNAFDLPLHNAFGMTETMQVLSTLVPGRYRAVPGSLGNPLPGVELRLDSEGLPPGQRRLLLRSPFGFLGYLGRQLPAAPKGGWFSTGDLVEERDDDLYYLGREEADFINDGLGLKISRLRLDGLYADLDPSVEAAAFFPLQREPGMAALFFVRGGEDSGQAVVDRELLGHLRAALESRLEQLHDRVEELEFAHLAVGRFAAVSAAAPRTLKGNLRIPEVERRWPSLLQRLVGRYSKHPEVVLVERERYTRSASIRLTSPRLGELMRLLELDKHYVRGEGDRLTFRDRGEDREVVDLVGGYGGNLLGHRNPALVAALSGFLADGGIPLFDQGSVRPEQGELARRLALAVGGVTGRSFVVRFGSTGAEAVEIALAHACLERDERIRRLVRDQKRRFGHRHTERVREIVELIREKVAEQPPRVLALEGAYHGHSLGARSLVFNPKMRNPFVSMAAVEPIFLPRGFAGDLAQRVSEEQIAVRVLEEREGRVEEQTLFLSRIIAAVAEPVQGEGGVREVPAPLLEQLGAFDFPLIIDEIQTGLGRCGTLLASQGVRADYYLLSKALGGGLVKIAAVLIDRSRYLPRFDELYASTFAGDAQSSAVASRVLELVSAERVPERCRERGEVLRRALLAVKEAYPDVVGDVRGRGLLLAVELDRRCLGGSLTLRTLAEREALGATAASYLLNRHGLRLLPTLSAPDVLRIEPSAFIDDAAIEQVGRGLSGLCQHLREGDAAALLGHLARDEEMITTEAEDAQAARISVEVEEADPDSSRVAFVFHFVFPERELWMVDPSLRRLSPAVRRSLAGRFMGLLELHPTLVFARHLFQRRLWFAGILIPADVGQLETLHRMDYRYLETERLQQAVDLAARHGCTCVALGGYTSILARDGEAIMPPPGVRVTSGNTFTVVVGARRILEACAALEIDPAAEGSCLGVVGATGNIGSALGRRLLGGESRFRRALLVGRSPEHLDRLREELTAAGVSAELHTSTDLAELRRCNIIAVATNTNEPLIYPEHLSLDRPVVIADVSVPSVVSREVRGLGNIRVLALAGTIVVPDAPDLRLSSHTPPGTAFCCAAEAMLVGLEPEATAGLRLTGRIEAHSMEVLDGLAERHGLFAALGEGGFKVG